MIKQYIIVGRKEDVLPKVSGNTEVNTCEASDIRSFTGEDYEYLRRVFPDGKEVVLEHNIATGEKLVLIPFEQKFGTGIKAEKWTDELLDLLLKEKQRLGFWPLRELNFETAKNSEL